MNRQRTAYLLALSLLGTALGASNVLADGPNFTAIDFPGATSTTPWGVNSRGVIAGLYTSGDKVTHGFLLSGGQYSTIDFPGATYKGATAVTQRGDILGR